MAMKLNLDEGLIAEARERARRIAIQVMDMTAPYSTVSVERTVLRLLGIDGVNREGIPWANVLVDMMKKEKRLEGGAANWIGHLCLAVDCEVEEVPALLVEEKIPVSLPVVKPDRIHSFLGERTRRGVNRIKKQRERRQELFSHFPPGPRPYLYVIVATGNIYEDVKQAVAAAKDGADIVAVIRSTAQSLLDFVPYGATTEGYGGTYATQENFRIMRKALDEVGEEVGRYIQLVNYCSGLCMPEIAAMGALERLDMMLNDAMYGILFRDINMERTFIDQHFSRMINAYAGIIINTGEDNYLTTADSMEAGHTVLASQFINEQLGLLAGLTEEQLGLGHAFELDPNMTDGLLLELAQAQLSRDIFPNSPLKYMPPTKHMTGNIFHVHLVNGLFNLISVFTGQGIQLLGMMTEGIHTPHLQDRALSIKNARYVMNNARHLGEELMIREGGRIEKRARDILNQAASMLQKIEGMGLPKALEAGFFAAISRPITGGKGQDGVFEKAPDYCNPFLDAMAYEEGCRHGF